MSSRAAGVLPAFSLHPPPRIYTTPHTLLPACTSVVLAGWLRFSRRALPPVYLPIRSPVIRGACVEPSSGDLAQCVAPPVCAAKQWLTALPPRPTYKGTQSHLRCSSSMPPSRPSMPRPCHLCAHSEAAGSHLACRSAPFQRAS
jgi:hypothetical protein